MAGLGSLVDVASPNNIYITTGGKSGPAGSLTLDASELNSIGAGSLLIGGIRSSGANGTTITVETNNIEVDNAGMPLVGPDIVLVANDQLKLDPGAKVVGSGPMSGQTLPLTVQDATALKGAGAAASTFHVRKATFRFLFPNGTPGNDTLTATGRWNDHFTRLMAERLLSRLAVPLRLQAGSTVTLDAGGGTVAFQSGSGWCDSAAARRRHAPPRVSGFAGPGSLAIFAIRCRLF